MVKIGIIGSRRRDSEDDLKKTRSAFQKLTKIFGIKNLSIVSGGCPKGGDRFAEIIAKEYDVPIKIHRPDKSKLDPNKMKNNPRWAYAEINYARNTLVAEDSDIIIACVSDDRKGGTEDTIKKFISMKKKSCSVILA